jgi:hypothetical protein
VHRDEDQCDRPVAVQLIGDDRASAPIASGFEDETGCDGEGEQNVRGKPPARAAST